MTSGLIHAALRLIRGVTGIDLSGAAAPAAAGKPAQAWISDYWTMQLANPRRSLFRLDVDGSVAGDPSDDDIRRGLVLVAGGQKEFLILSRHDAPPAVRSPDLDDDDDDDRPDDVGDDFLQVVREAGGAIRLEFGVPGFLGRPVVAAVNGAVSQQAVADALIDYRRRGATWLCAGSWRYVTAPVRSSP